MIHIMTESSPTDFLTDITVAMLGQGESNGVERAWGAHLAKY